MAELTDLNDIINRMTGGSSGTPEAVFCYIDSRVGSGSAQGTVVGRWTSFWEYNKFPGGQGVPPTTAEAPTSSTTGAIAFTNPGGGRQKWLVGMGGFSRPGTIMLYDRLLHRGGLSGTVTTAQTVGGTITRNTGGVGNQIWLEIYTSVGTTAVDVTVSYTNSSGTSGRISRPTTIGGTGLREVQRMIPIVLADGDVGVQSVQSVTLSATTATAGNFGVVILKPIATTMVAAAGAGFQTDFVTGLPNIPEILPNSCLGVAFYAASTTAPQTLLTLGMIEK